MEQLLILLTTVTLLLIPSIVATDSQDAAEGTNAQAVSGNSGSSSGLGSDKLVLVRRYVPRFIGKRDEDGVEQVDSIENTDNSEDDLSNVDEYIERLLDYYDDLDLTSSENEDLEQDSLSEIETQTFERDESDEMRDEEDEEEDDLNISEDKRYIPSFVGKRFQSLDDDEDSSMLLDKRYRPMFVGKRYRPMFVGKRYKPMFVGKRYQPKFIGKRYTPTFVGKRFAPTFVGKRYAPRFIGKRFAPTFVGKRYTPRFVGKRYTPRFIGKRYTPRFVGKRYTPRFVGKRYTPRFVGKRLQPVFVGKKSSTSSEDLDKRYTPYFVGKRSLENVPSDSSHIEKRSVSDSNDMSSAAIEESTEKSSRKKRSLADSDGAIPWQMSTQSGYQLSDGPSSYLEKRFVAPEFIGRRDSLSTILSALDALQYARNKPRTTSKRFEAPLFIGKRAPRQPMFVGKRNPVYSNEMNVPDRYIDIESIPGLSEIDLNALDKYQNEQKLNPFRRMFSYSGVFPSNFNVEK